MKFKADGSIERHKTRFVARVYTQQAGIDSLDACSLVAKLRREKLLFALTAIYNWSMAQVDVNNTFLQGDLLEEAYMDLPPGYVISKWKSLPLNSMDSVRLQAIGQKPKH